MTIFDLRDSHTRCSQLIAYFYRCIDTGEIAAAAKLFGATGTWLRQGITLNGEVDVFAALVARTEGRKSSHLVSNIVIDSVGPDIVSVRYFVTATVQNPGEKARLAAILDSKDSIDLSGPTPVFLSKQATVHIAFD